MKKAFLLVFLLTAFIISAETLVIKGSNTVYPVAQLWAEEFKKLHPDVDISIEGAGSSTGIKALFNRQTDIANASRWLKSSEIEKMNAEGRYFIPFIVAYDGIAIIVNKSLGIDSITIDQLYKIYSGKITKWNQIDPSLPKKRIVVYSRDNASGTFEYFVEHVMKKEKFAPYVQMLPSTNAEVERVKQNKYAIGYIGMGYVTDEVKALKVEGIEPTVENVNTGKYPISRPLFMFVDATEGLPTGLVMDFIRFVLSPEGQALVLKVGYVNAYGIEK
ncbi:PstS family phosphate ABC transporter substrate-binding protein [Kosmotoga sp. DU53]|uniref:PstS family phosphate ABC transporter substrate-binding protein n=1 Tax=Kosmotoga sp. DU53 TaxID=1310160 RepID=UPI0007C554DA|nr:PstS family phosphate ABC transporter substrate-binding protein [Kosmotoga sp. DU53]OAA21233.1 phosphate ABC transporter substrate-binding protein [Kosmotoga sp. DU53]